MSIRRAVYQCVFRDAGMQSVPLDAVFVLAYEFRSGCASGSMPSILPKREKARSAGKREMKGRRTRDQDCTIVSKLCLMWTDSGKANTRAPSARPGSHHSKCPQGWRFRRALQQFDHHDPSGVRKVGERGRNRIRNKTSFQQHAGPRMTRKSHERRLKERKQSANRARA